MRNVLLIMALLLATTTMQSWDLFAAEQLSKAPEVGMVVDVVDMQSHYIVLNDVGYQVADYAIVRNAKGSVVSKNSVKAGDLVGVTTGSTNSDETSVITEIRILPSLGSSR